jgi:hypothetical protein
MAPENLDALFDRRVAQAVEVEEAGGSSVLLLLLLRRGCACGVVGGGGGAGIVVVVGPVLGCGQGRGREEGVVWVGPAAGGLAALWAEVKATL